MGLPSIPLPKSSVEIGGQTVEFRSLTRKELLKLDGVKDPTAIGNVIVSCGCGVTEEEADAWLEATPVDEGVKLINAIIALSGIPGEAKANLTSANKRSTKGHS